MDNFSCCYKINLSQIFQGFLDLGFEHSFIEDLLQNRPHLFSPICFLLDQTYLKKIDASIKLIENIFRKQPFQDFIKLRELENFKKHEIIQNSFGPHGACIAYDFHINTEGMYLIEINTNAGGLMLNLLLQKVWSKLITSLPELVDVKNKVQSNQNQQLTSNYFDRLENSIFNMFKNEWLLQKEFESKTKVQNPTLHANHSPFLTEEKSLINIAIVDDNVKDQYLYPEFLLYQKLFEKNKINAFIVDPINLKFDSTQNELLYENKKIDLVYNRSTDFYFEEIKHEPIRSAYLNMATVITPNPWNHAIYADKRHFISFNNQDFLNSLQLNQNEKNLLSSVIPLTQMVTQQNYENLWADRKNLFFKPTSGYGSKAVYRGDKITKKVWNEIIHRNDYLAQKIIIPSECGGRALNKNNQSQNETKLKFDLRVFCYQGEIQLLATRFYAGQTTNFRSEGGGFAPVFIF